MEIYLIRHTRVEIPRTVCYGASDVALSNSYLTDKQIVTSKISPVSDALIYSSPLKRCRQLAQDMFVNITFDERLKEYNFGDWELKKWVEVPKREMDFWGKDIVNNRPPNGENMQDVLDRALDFWHSIITTQLPDNQQVYIVTHSGVIRTLICHFLEIPLKNAFRMGIDYGSISRISVHEKYVTIDYINR